MSQISSLVQLKELQAQLWCLQDLRGMLSQLLFGVRGCCSSERGREGERERMREREREREREDHTSTFSMAEPLPLQAASSLERSRTTCVKCRGSGCVACAQCGGRGTVKPSTGNKQAKLAMSKCVRCSLTLGGCAVC